MNANVRQGFASLGSLGFVAARCFRSVLRQSTLLFGATWGPTGLFRRRRVARRDTLRAVAVAVALFLSVSTSGVVASVRGAASLPLAETAKAESADLQWGAEVEGLRAAVELVPAKAQYEVGEKIPIRFHYGNVSGKDISFVTPTWVQGAEFVVTDDKGIRVHPITSVSSGKSKIRRVTLQPGAELAFEAPAMGFAVEPGPSPTGPAVGYSIAEVAGLYTVQFRLRIPCVERHGVDPTDDVPQPGDWQGTLETGPVIVDIVAATTVGATAGAETPDISSRIDSLIGTLGHCETGFDRGDLRDTSGTRELLRIGTPAIPKLIEALKHPDAPVRRDAAFVLGRIGDGSAAEPLLELCRQEQRLREPSSRLFPDDVLGPAVSAFVKIRTKENSVENAWMLKDWGDGTIRALTGGRYVSEHERPAGSEKLWKEYRRQYPTPFVQLEDLEEELHGEIGRRAWEGLSDDLRSVCERQEDLNEEAQKAARQRLFGEERSFYEKQFAPDSHRRELSIQMLAVSHTVPNFQNRASDAREWWKIADKFLSAERIEEIEARREALFGELAKRGPEVLPEMIRLSDPGSSAWSERSGYICEVAKRIGPSAIPVVEEFARTYPKFGKYWAMPLIGAIPGPEAETTLRRALSDESPRGRDAAFYELVRRGARIDAATARQRLGSESMAVLEQAMDIAVRQHDRDAIEPIEALAAKYSAAGAPNYYHDVVLKAQAALRELGVKPTDVPDFIPPQIEDGRGEWGEPVEGVRVRVRMEENSFTEGKDPTFTIDLWSREEHLLPSYGPGIDMRFSLCVDGVWYMAHPFGAGLASGGPTLGRERTLGFYLNPRVWLRDDDHESTTSALSAGNKVNHLDLPLWRSLETRTRMSALSPGGHHIQVAFLLNPDEASTSQPLRAVSNSLYVRIDEKFPGDVLELTLAYAGRSGPFREGDTVDFELLVKNPEEKTVSARAYFPVVGWHAAVETAQGTQIPISRDPGVEFKPETTDFPAGETISLGKFSITLVANPDPSKNPPNCIHLEPGKHRIKMPRVTLESRRGPSYVDSNALELEVVALDAHPATKGSR